MRYAMVMAMFYTVFFGIAVSVWLLVRHMPSGVIFCAGLIVGSSLMRFCYDAPEKIVRWLAPLVQRMLGQAK